MKKKLEAELISIAHRILKLTGKSELAQLQQEAQNLYEKLSVLRFVEEHFDGSRPTIGKLDIDEKIAAVFDTGLPKEAPSKPVEMTEATADQNAVAIAKDDHKHEEIIEPDNSVLENEPKPQTSAAPETATNVESPEATVEPVAAEDSFTSEPEPAEKAEQTQSEAEPSEKSTEKNAPEKPESKSGDAAFKPAFELSFETKQEAPEVAKPEEKTSKQIVFEDFLGKNYVDPVFVKPEELHKEAQTTKDAVIPISRNSADSSNVIPLKKESGGQTQTLNDRMSKGITIGLNDRVAFMKHLFNNSSEDYNRVLSQLITFDTLPEARSFIDNMVRPDYNNWEGKDEYAQRFMDIIERRFS